MKIRLVGVEFFHADGQTNMMKLRIALSNVAKALKNYQRFGKKLTGLFRA
jgi:hypothetical protein